jgi:hypothetical protein
MKAFWVESCVTVADVFGISCGTQPWLADEVKWEALSVQHGLDLSFTKHECEAPLWYWDLNRTTFGIGRKTALNVKAVARVCGDINILYVLCHRVSHPLIPNPLPPYPKYSRWVYLTGGSFINSGSVEVKCRPEDNYDTFIRRLFEVPAANTIWPRALNKLREKKFHVYDDFRMYIISLGSTNDLYNMIVYLTDGTRKCLDQVLWRLKWSGRGQRFHIGDILPANAMIVMMNSAEEARAWAFHTAYLRIPLLTITYSPECMPCNEEQFKRYCIDHTANCCDDLDTHVIPVNGRIKRPIHVWHSSVIRDTPAYQERFFMLTVSAGRLANGRNIYLTI